MEIGKISTYYPDKDGEYFGYKIGVDNCLHIAPSDQFGKIGQQGSPGYFRVLFTNKEMLVLPAADFEANWIED